MPSYLFQIELPPFSTELLATIPMHRQHIEELFSDGALLSYSVAVNRDMIWCVINATNEQVATDQVVAFPLYKFFIDVKCNPLLFHNILPSQLPGIVLN
jgi:hypothetical protein